MLNRRDAMVRLGQVGLGALALPELLRAEAAAASEPPPRPSPTGGGGGNPGGGGSAKSCILLFLWGGPPQMDMWDMKPEAPDGIRTLFKPIRTNADGIELCEHMPLLAKQ